jgi:predicted AlkP superfamily pyrophosphatase or phosphodiesterase
MGRVALVDGDRRDVESDISTPQRSQNHATIWVTMNRGTQFLAAFALAYVWFVTVGGQQVPLRPKLVLVVSIDQMRVDYLSRFTPLYTGGLKRLIDRGAVFNHAYYRHASTETGPGHAVLLSGRHPSHSGIVANEWWDPFLKKSINVVDDPFHRPVGGEGRSASPANALSFTVGDALKLKTAGSRVVGVSLKDRSAILMAGRRGDAAYWYEVDGGNFITSTYYADEAPPWLTRWNRLRLPDQYAGKKWVRLLADDEAYKKYAGADAIEGEWDRKDTVFPHAIRGNPPERLYYDDFRRTPFADEVTLSIALEAMKAHQLGQDEDTDIFAVGFSATDVIGHTYGPESQEVMDQLLRLDSVLDKLFQAIDDSVGLDNTLVVLSADHGSLPLVENLQSQGIDARRASPNILRNAVQDAFARRFPGIQGLIAYFATDIYLDEDVIRLNRLDRETLERTAIDALMSTGLVEKVYTHSDLMTTYSADPQRRLFQNAFFQPRSPHLNVLLKKYVYLSSQVGGTGHGTAHDYDRHVPIVFMGQQIKSGLYQEECGPEDIAPTIAHLLGLTFPREYDSRLLLEMLTVN